MTEIKKNSELKAGDYIAISDFRNQREPALVTDIEEMDSQFMTEVISVTCIRMNGRTETLRMSKDKEAKIYKFKRGEKTIVKKILTKMRKQREKLEELQKKVEAEELKVMELGKVSMKEYVEFAKEQKVFEKLPIENLLKKYNVDLSISGTNPEKLELHLSKETEKYQNEDSYPFLYEEYDLSLHIHENIFEEVVKVSLEEKMLDKIQKVVNENKMTMEIKTFGDVGDKNYVSFNMVIKIGFKNKFNWEKFEKFVKELSEIGFTEEKLSKYLNVKIK